MEEEGEGGSRPTGGGGSEVVEPMKVAEILLLRDRGNMSEAPSRDLC